MAEGRATTGKGMARMGRRVKYWIKVKTRTKGGARAESTVEGREL